MQLHDHGFWLTLSGKTFGQLNDLQFIILRFNGYLHSNTDMYAAWRAEGFPELTPVT